MTYFLLNYCSVQLDSDITKIQQANYLNFWERTVHLKMILIKDHFFVLHNISFINKTQFSLIRQNNKTKQYLDLSLWYGRKCKTQKIGMR